MTTKVDRRLEPPMIRSQRRRTHKGAGTLPSPEGGVMRARSWLDWRGHRPLKRGCSGGRSAFCRSHCSVRLFRS